LNQIQGGLILKTTKVLIALLMVTTGLFALVTDVPTTTGLPPANGNWIVSVAETVTGGSYNVTNGNLIIQKGGTLTLDGTTVLINDTNGQGGMQYFVEIQNGGALIMKNGALIRSSMNGSNWYYFYIRQGAKATIAYSNISDVGGPAGWNWNQLGIYIQSSDVTIDHTDITRGGTGIIIDQCNPTISNDTIYKNDGYGIDISAGSPYIYKNNISDNGRNWFWWQQAHGINIWNSNPRIDYNLIKNNGWGNSHGWGIYAQVSNLTIRNNTITKNAAGGMWLRNHANGILADNSIIDNSDIGIWIEAVSDPMVLNNKVHTLGWHSLQVDGVSSPYVSGNQFNSTNDIGIHVDGPSTLTMVKNDLKVWSSNANNYDGIDVNDNAVAYIKNNTIYVARGNGMNYWNWAKGTVAGNTVTVTQGSGINIWNWAEVTVSSNNVNSSNDALDVWDFSKVRASDNVLVSRNSRGINTGWWTEFHTSGGSVTSRNEGVTIGPNTVATVDDTVIAATNDNGVEVTGRTTVSMSRDTISSKNVGGLYVTDSVVDIVNSSITAGGPDIRLGNSAQASPGLIRTLNTTFNESDTVFDNDNSRLNVSWYAEKIWAEWQNSQRVPNASLAITNIHNKVVFNGTLDANGEIDWLPVQEYSQVRTLRDDFTRHNFSASKNGVSSFAGATVNTNVNIRIILQDLVNDPVIDITHPVDNGIYNISLIEVNGTAYDPESGIHKVTVWPQGSVQKTAFGTEKWDAWVNLTDGKWTIMVNATNFAGVIKREQVSITVDTVPPILIVDYPHATELVNTTNIAFKGKTEPGANVTVNGVIATVDAKGNFSCNITLPEGVNTVVVASHDKAMNFNISKPIVTVDLTPPAIKVFAPVDGLITIDSTVMAAGSAEPGATVSVNGTSIPHVGEPFSAIVPLKEGNNRLVFLAKDPAGNRNVTVRNVIYDPTPPEVSVNNPPGTFLTNSTTINISGTAKDLTLFRVTVNGVNVTTDGVGNYSLIVTLKEGLNVIEVVGYDKAGHTTTVQRAITLDTVPPPLDIVQPVNGLVTNQPTIHVIGTTEVGAKVTVDGANAVVGTDGKFDYAKTLKEGVNAVRIVAKDPAGNPAPVTRSVTLDTQPPVLKVSTPTKGKSVSEVELEVKGSVTDNLAVAKVTVNGKEVKVTNGKFSTTLLLPRGDTKIVVVATDTAGNAVTQEIKVSRGPMTMAEGGLLALALILLVVGIILGLMLAKRKAHVASPKGEGMEGRSRFHDEETDTEAGEKDEAEAEAKKAVAPPAVRPRTVKVSTTGPQVKPEDKVAPGPITEKPKVEEPPKPPEAPKKPEGQEADKAATSEKKDIEDIMKKLKT
jgi:parallel beta-helix repeat protein